MLIDEMATLRTSLATQKLSIKDLQGDDEFTKKHIDIADILKMFAKFQKG